MVNKCINTDFCSAPLRVTMKVGYASVNLNTTKKMNVFSGPKPERALALLEDSGLPTSDLDTKQFENFLYLGDTDDPVGIIGLEIIGSVALLRSLAVTKDAQGNGYGKTLVFAIEDYAKSKNINELYLLTETAKDFFKNLNYTSIQKESAPESIKNTSEFSSVCPQSAVLMNKKLHR